MKPKMPQMDSEVKNYFGWLVLIAAWATFGLAVIFVFGWMISLVPIPQTYEQQAIESCKAAGGIVEYHEYGGWNDKTEVECKNERIRQR